MRGMTDREINGFLKKLDELNVIKEKQSKQPRGYSYIYKNVIENCRDILRGDWNLDDFRTAEEGACWMLAYISMNLLAEPDMITVSDKIGVSLLPNADLIFGFDIKQCLLSELDGLDLDDDERANMIKYWRKIIDRVAINRAAKLSKRETV